MCVGFGALEFNALTCQPVTLGKSLNLHEPQPPRCLRLTVIRARYCIACGYDARYSLSRCLNGNISQRFKDGHSCRWIAADPETPGLFGKREKWASC